MKSLKKCLVAAIFCTLVSSRALAEELSVSNNGLGKQLDTYSLSKAEYEKVIADKLGKIEEVKIFNDKNELGFREWRSLTKKNEEGGTFFVYELLNSFVGDSNQNLFLKREREYLYYDTKFPYPLVKRHVLAENLDVVTKQVVSTEEKLLTRKGAEWVLISTKSDSSKVKVKSLPFKETPNFLSVIALNAWSKNVDRSIEDKFKYQIVDLDDASVSENKAYVLKKEDRLVDGKLKSTQLTISLQSEHYEIKQDVDLSDKNYVTGTISTGSRFTLQDLESNFALNDFHKKENEVLDVVGVKQFIDRKLRFKDGQFTFLATLSDKTKAIPESPDQIVSVVDKEKGIFRISLGHGINKSYRLTGNDSLVTEEDSEIPDKWLNDIKAEVGANATQLALLNATLKFVNRKFIFQKDYGNGQSLKQIVKDMQGKCVHISQLTAAILRRLGVRAQMIGGYSNPDFFGGDDGPHAVVEAMIDGKSVLFEPQYSELKPLQNPTGLFFKLNTNSTSIDDTFISNLQFENVDLPETKGSDSTDKENENKSQKHNNSTPRDEVENEA